MAAPSRGLCPPWPRRAAGFGVALGELLCFSQLRWCCCPRALPPWAYPSPVSTCLQRLFAILGQTKVFRSPNLMELSCISPLGRLVCAERGVGSGWARAWHEPQRDPAWPGVCSLLLRAVFPGPCAAQTCENPALPQQHPWARTWFPLGSEPCKINCSRA